MLAFRTRLTLMAFLIIQPYLHISIHIRIHILDILRQQPSPSSSLQHKFTYSAILATAKKLIAFQFDPSSYEPPSGVCN
jgi:hypothetical protein